MCKPTLNAEVPDADRFAASLAVLQVCLVTGLKLLHPVMPFITEELYHRIPLLQRETRADSIMVARYPEPSKVGEVYVFRCFKCSKIFSFSVGFLQK